MCVCVNDLHSGNKKVHVITFEFRQHVSQIRLDALRRDLCINVCTYGRAALFRTVR